MDAPTYLILVGLGLLATTISVLAYWVYRLESKMETQDNRLTTLEDRPDA